MTAIQTKTGDHMSCSVSLAIKFMTCPVEMVARAAGDRRNALRNRAVRIPVLCAANSKAARNGSEQVCRGR